MVGHNAITKASANDEEYLCIATYLGYRLQQLGVTHVFVVPGDFNLPLLDGLSLVPGLTLVACANELDCAYAADGAARASGLGVLITTFLVGALSALNGVAGAFAEDVPLLSIVGVPSNEEYSSGLELHHTLGNAEDMSQEVDCYRPVTRYQCMLRSMFDARYLIDRAISKALLHRKPVLMEVCRDMPLLPHASFGRAPPLMPAFPLPRYASDAACIASAAAAVRAFLADKATPLILVGRRARQHGAQLTAFADATGYAVASQYEGKGFFNEQHPSYLGVAFGPFSSPAAVKDVVAESDAILFVGCHFDEFNWAGHVDDALLRRSVLFNRDRVVVGLETAFVSCDTGEVLSALTTCSDGGAPLERNPGALDLFNQRTAKRAANAAAAAPGSPAGPLSAASSSASLAPAAAAGGAAPAPDSRLEPITESAGGGSGGGLIGDASASLVLNAEFTAPAFAPLKLDGVLDAVQQELLSCPNMDMLLDVGDTTLRAHALRLPSGCSYEVQTQAGNIGWSYPAGLGYSLASASARPGRRLLVIGGDGALQMTVQELGNYAKYGSNAIMLVVNNDGYLIERFLSAVPHAPYNYPKRWNITGVVEAMCNGEGKYKVIRVSTLEEAQAALRTARKLTDHFVFIEAIVHPADAAPGAGLFRAGFIAKNAPPGSAWDKVAAQLNAGIGRST